MATRFPHLAFVSLSGGRPTSCSTVGASGFYSEGGPLAQRPTTEELARHILRRLYEATDGRPMEWRTLVTNKTADAAVELAVECGWLLADGDKGVCLTHEGRSLVRKELS
jgi:hypothetical protein